MVIFLKTCNLKRSLDFYNKKFLQDSGFCVMGKRFFFLFAWFLSIFEMAFIFLFILLICSFEKLWKLLYFTFLYLTMIWVQECCNDEATTKKKLFHIFFTYILCYYNSEEINCELRIAISINLHKNICYILFSENI